jgi:integrase
VALAEYPRLKARQLKSKVRYYYRHPGGREEPLGAALQDALQRYQGIAARAQAAGPDSLMHQIFALYLASEDFKSLAPGTAYGYRLSMRRLTSVWGEARFEDFDAQKLKLYMAGSTAKTRAKNDLSAFSAVWSWALEEGLTHQANPRFGVTLRTHPKGKKPVLAGVAPEAFAAVYARADQVLKDVLDLLVLGGQDVGVVLGWRRTQIKDGYLETQRRKTGVALRIRITGRFGEVIQDCLTRPRKATGPWIVQTDAGQRVSYPMLKERFTAARKAAGVWFEFRALRRQAASDAQSLEHAQELLGHRLSSTTAAFYRKGPKVDPVA